MKKGNTIILCGLAAIVVTVLLYLVIVGSGLWGAIHFVSLAAVILAEAVTTAYAYFAKGSPRKVAAAIWSGVMIPFAVILSVIYIINFPFGYGKYLGWYFAGTVVVNAICMILIRFDTNKKDEDTQLQVAKNNMLMLRKLVKCIMAEPGAQEYYTRLMALEEKLHFSNDTVISAEDQQIHQLLVQMQENVRDAQIGCEELLAKIELLVARRSAMRG